MTRKWGEGILKVGRGHFWVGRMERGPFRPRSGRNFGAGLQYGLTPVLSMKILHRATDFTSNLASVDLSSPIDQAGA